MNAGRTELLQREVCSSGAAVAPAGQQLKEILAEPAFAEKMRQASAWEQWRRQVDNWLWSHLSSLFHNIAKHPTTSMAIFWIVALAALGFIAVQLFQIFRGDERIGSLRYSKEEMQQEQASIDWIASARAASGASDFNRAIQCAYWAGVACLRTSGALPKTTGLTPRELLRFHMSNADLGRITSSLERFWYARLPAKAEDFDVTLKSVEALGCKLD